MGRQQGRGNGRGPARPQQGGSPPAAGRGNESFQGLVEVIAESLVDEPDNVEVTEIEGDHNTLIELKVARHDIGKVIGKDGRTAQSIRTLLSAASTKAGRRVHLDILD